MESTWPFSAEPRTVTIASRHIFAGDPICFVYHEWDLDAWQFLPDHATESSDAIVVCLKEVYELDNSIGELADLPNGWMASRSSRASPWQRERNHPFPVFADNGYYLDDAEDYESEFRIPSVDRRNNLSVGDMVKLIFRFAYEWAPRKDNECERMWVKILEVDSDNRYYRGQLLNDPHLHSTIASGHELWFHPVHVFDVHEETNDQ